MCAVWHCTFARRGSVLVTALEYDDDDGESVLENTK